METTRRTILQHTFIVTLLTRFKHRSRTDVAAGFLTNKDFIILAMYAYGPLGLRELQELSTAWRGNKRRLDSYFVPHYGHTAITITGNVRFGGRYCGAKARRITKCWYRSQLHESAVPHEKFGTRPMVCYANDLTYAGLLRARKLLQVPG